MKALILTYALTYGGAAASLFNPFIGLLIYVSFAIIKPDYAWHWSVPEGNYSRVVALGLLAGWALHGFGRWDFGRARGIVLALVGFWVWSALSAVGAADQDRAWGTVEALTKIVLPVVVGATTITTTRQLRLLAWVIVLSQGYVAYEANLSYYDGTNVLKTIGWGGMDNNSIAIALVTCVGVGFFLWLHSEGWWRKLIVLGMLLLMIHAVLFTFSRGGILALLITGLVSFFLLPRRPKHYLLFVVIALIGWRLAGAEVQKRFASTFNNPEERDASAESRVELWKDCLVVMKERPLLGVGPHHFPLIAARFGWPSGKEAHSLWLQIGAEVGVPGMTFLLLYYGLTMIRLRPLARESTPVPDPWLRYIARMVIAGTIGFAVSAQFVSLVGLEVPYYVVLMGVGALKVKDLQAKAAQRSRLAERGDQKQRLAGRGDYSRAAPALAPSYR